MKSQQLSQATPTLSSMAARSLPLLGLRFDFCEPEALLPFGALFFLKDT